MTIYGIPDKDDLDEDQQYIVQGLYSWWLRESLALIEESYGLSFTEEDTNNARMKLKLFEEDSGLLAYVNPDESDFKKLEVRTLGINMDNFQDISSGSDRHSKSDIDGKIFQLDRTLIHELVHGVMASNVDYFINLTLPIIEGGTAELVHGVDDERRNDIIDYVKNEKSFKKIVQYLHPESAGVEMGAVPYAGGYIFMRYFLKQAATDTTFDYDTYRENVSVDEENFATNYHDKVTMTGSSDSDTISNSGKNVVINAQGGANVINSYSDKVTITSGAGTDSITSEGSDISITSGAGKDSINNYALKAKITSGAGNDYILNFTEDAPRKPPASAVGMKRRRFFLNF